MSHPPHGSTRVVIKNVPKKASVDDLSKFLQQHGFVASQLTLKPPSLAFCGLVDHPTAQQVVNTLHHAYFRTSKLHVELARPRNATTTTTTSSSSSESKTVGSQRERTASESAKAGTESKVTNKVVAKKQFWANDDHNNIDIVMSNNSDNNDTASQSDMDFLKSKTTGVADLEATGTATSTCRLYVSNLPYSAQECDVRAFFENFGPLSECKVVMDDANQSRGYGFVRFVHATDAQRAMNETDDFQGRLLHLEWARPPPSTTTDSHLSLTSFKETRAQQRQRDSSQTSWNTTFVRSDAVVDNLAARLGLKKTDILNVKESLSAGDAAVRLALAETSLIEENRKFFREHGMDMEALVSLKQDDQTDGTATTEPPTKVQRSTTSFLVKNLPFDTSLSELEKLFDLNDPEILLPPSHTIAVVSYQNASDARYAFRKHSYRRFKSVPLYLEWAPLDSHVDDRRQPQDGQEASENQLDDNEEDEQVVGPNATLFVKNLNFSTTEAALEQHFERFGVRAIRIPQKVAPQKANSSAAPSVLSMGYGFVEFRDRNSAQKALHALQGKKLDGHALDLQSSSTKAGTGSATKAASSANTKSAKLMVRNVPFQANRKELLQLFGSFGQLKKLRLPKKFDGSHRGFAFVEYLSHKEAAAALKSLSRTHLYGRHLVIEFAEKDETHNIEQLREKAVRDISMQPKGKKIRFE